MHTVDTEQGWWTGLPAARAVRLVGATFDQISLCVEPLPDSGPAVLSCQPAGAGPLVDQVGLLLTELERAATALFPDWLPGAANIIGPQGMGISAVRALAFDRAATTAHFGPFLADLAESALTGARAQGRRYAHEVRAQGLARVIADSYGRRHTALLIEEPAGLSAADERALVSAAEWLAHHGGFMIWLAGDRLTTNDRLDV